jgi:hypothetical protein
MLQTTDHVELEQAGNKHDSTERKDGENELGMHQCLLTGSQDDRSDAMND